MSNDPSNVAIADTVSDLMYGLAGWLLIGLGTLAVAGGIGGVIQTAGTAEMAAPVLLLGFAFLFITSGVFVNPRFRRRLARRREATSFGRTKSVDRRVLATAENRRELCTNCGCTLTEGLVRRYREEFLIAGVPVWTISKSKNFYCPECAVEDMSVPTVTQSDQKADTERVVIESE
jgi:hypothetical protein